MHDPFPIPASPWLSKAVQPFADYVGFTTLPLHIHEVVGSFLFYYAINVFVSPYISRKIVPNKYAKLSPERKISWDVHVVSLVQSSLINILALWVMWTDEERKGMDWKERVWAYTGAAGMIQGMATGYFLWDLIVTLQNVKLFGLGTLAHATSALIVFSFGFRPFVNFYGCTFILYELSTPFLNFHWFFDKLDMTGSKAQLYNGIMLLLTFAGCRLVWGTYQSIRVYQDVWAAIHHKPAAANIHIDALNNSTSGQADALAGNSAAPIHSDIMRFAGEEYIPLWLAFTYLGSNVVLNTLNFYWFGKMIETLKKRFEPPKDEVRKSKAVATKSTGANGKVRIDLDETEIRRRKGAGLVAVSGEEPLGQTHN
ncbi:putative TLC domain-containing protein [Lachnellula suecica]|uniref:Putative TLC domain-containing protein n=1 Tax=Lachnellula suecica TaxID=602035 RepID=A0A8T9C891_9HELO|nr:putative TLC domain-containing protein [Lachnellula suecica]